MSDDNRTLRARSEGIATVFFWCPGNCDDDGECGGHIDEADWISDKNGFLFYTLHDPPPEGPAARLVAAQYVHSVEFPDITVARAEDATFVRTLIDLPPEEIQADALTPEQFATGNPNGDGTPG